MDNSHLPSEEQLRQAVVIAPESISVNIAGDELFVRPKRPSVFQWPLPGHQGAALKVFHRQNHFKIDGRALCKFLEPIQILIKKYDPKDDVSSLRIDFSDQDYGTLLREGVLKKSMELLVACPNLSRLFIILPPYRFAFPNALAIEETLVLIAPMCRPLSYRLGDGFRMIIDSWYTAVITDERRSKFGGYAETGQKDVMYLFDTKLGDRARARVRAGTATVEERLIYKLDEIR